jgi:lysophospholipase L1-like esterase
VRVKRLRRLPFIALGAFVVMIGVEILVSRRAPHLDGFPRPQLDGSVGKGDRPALRVAWVGDSLSAGVGASSVEDTLPHLVSERLGRPIDLHVLAVSGARASDAIVDQLPLLREVKADVIFIEIGANDVIHLTSRRRFRAELNQLLTFVEALDAERVIVVGIPAFGSVTLFPQPLRAIVGARGEMLDEDVRSAARAHDAYYIDIASATGEAIAREPDRMLARDRFHLSDDGYRLWTDAIMRSLPPLD